MPNSYRQCQRKTDRISDNFSNKIDKYLHDITRTYKESLNLLQNPLRIRQTIMDREVLGWNEKSSKTDVSITGSLDARCALRTLNTDKHLRSGSSQDCASKAEPVS